MKEPIDTISIKEKKSPKHFAENQIKMLLLKTILFLKNKQNKCY